MADNSSTLTHLEAPALDASYKENFKNLIDSINGNFKTLFDKITADNLIQNITIENEQGKLPGLLEALRTKLGLPNNGTQYNNLKSINITYYEYPDGTLHIPATTIIDEHYYSQIDNQIRSNLTDYTCMFTGIYNGREWNISILNSFPKIVYNNGSFVWQIGETITSINAQGLKGPKGDNTSVTSLRTITIKKENNNSKYKEEDGQKYYVIESYVNNNNGNPNSDINKLTSGTPAICVITEGGIDSLYSGSVIDYKWTETELSEHTKAFIGQSMILLSAITENDIDNIWSGVFNS